MFRNLSALHIVGALVLFGACAGLSAAAPATGDEYEGLPDAPGREEVVAYCGACHSMKLVVQQGLTRQAWAETLTWMYEEQGMPELPPDEEKLVLDYLAEHVGPEDQKQRLKEQGLRR